MKQKPPTPKSKFQPRKAIQVFKVVFPTSRPEKRPLSATEAFVAAVAILMIGALCASGLYGLATHDYTGLKSLSDALGESLPTLVKALK